VGEEVDEQRVGEHFWALQGIDMEVEEGEIVGIIGRNGAGKSTLLKLLSRITVPTEGVIRMKGRSSSLLEVGTGFNPELTGRENVYLNGAIMGMSRAEIDTKLDDIIAFSGIRHHIDTPTKRYSSGMKVRLGFAVAAHLDPEILIIDEVLAVGDAEFQRKCLGKMKDVSQSGRTILFVSHNMVSVRSLCSRVIWIHDGKVKEDGPTEDVVRNYLNNYIEKGESVQWSGNDAPGTDAVRIREVALRKPDPEELLLCTDTFHIEVAFDNLGIDDGDLRMNVHLINGADILVLASALVESAPDENIGALGPHRFRCEVPGDLLNSDDYRVVVNFVRKGKLHFRCEDTISFQLHDPARKDGMSLGRKQGVVRPRLNWSRVS
ncbi:MAG: ABC transporter ATP-binding protein, partial [Flavobacteriales bacterium]|nr:ABC transporter ATP-binding protein [Flavobacteriales bacterium]